MLRQDMYFAFAPLLLIGRRAFRFIRFSIFQQAVDDPRDLVGGGDGGLFRPFAALARIRQSEAA